MKKIITLFVAILLSICVIPVNTKAAKNSDKIKIYLFRGQGCTYCRSFLSFLNNINDEYGKYFELESYEVWYDADNNSLMKSIGEFMGQTVSGVPFIIIGDKVFAGYDFTGGDDAEIKSTIKSLYDTNKKDRYDVMTEYKKEHKLTGSYTSKNLKETLKDENIEYKESKKSSSTSSFKVDGKTVICFNLLFASLSTAGIIIYVRKKFNELNNNLSAGSTKKVAKNK